MALIINKRIWNSVLGCNLKSKRMILVHFRGKPFRIKAIQVYAPTTDTEEAEVNQFYENLDDLIELTLEKEVLFIIGDWNKKSRKSRDTWNNRQVWPWCTKWSGAEASWILPRECTGYSNHHFSTAQEMILHMNITKWPIPKSNQLHSLWLKMEKLFTDSKNKTWSWLWLRSSASHHKIQS